MAKETLKSRTPKTKGKNKAAERKALLGAAKRINSDKKNFATPENGGMYSKGYNTVKKLVKKARQK